MAQVLLLRQQVGEIDQALGLAMKEHAACLYRLCQIPGIQMDAAQELLSEIGPRAAAFASPERFASWVGVVRAVRNRLESATVIGAPKETAI